MTKVFLVRTSIFHVSGNSKVDPIGGILTIGDFERTFGIQHNETLKGVIVGTYDLGCLFGALATIWVGERVGRKWSILLGTVVMIIGAILQTFAFGIGVMIAGRYGTASNVIEFHG